MELSDEQVERLVLAAQTGRNVNNVTHDLNNMLGAIMAYADLMHMDATDDESKKKLEDIMICVQSGSSLLEKLTTISRVSKPDSRRPCLVQEALGAVQLLFNYEMKLARIDFQLDMAETIPKADISLPVLQRILMHLMANAVECEKERDLRAIRVGVVQDGATLVIHLSNGGLEASEDDVNAWFAPGTSSKEGNAGLGLTAARSMAEAYEGSLGYVQGQGFVLSLPTAS